MINITTMEKNGKDLCIFSIDTPEIGKMVWEVERDFSAMFLRNIADCMSNLGLDPTSIISGRMYGKAVRVA